MLKSRRTGRLWNLSYKTLARGGTLNAHFRSIRGDTLVAMKVSGESQTECVGRQTLSTKVDKEMFDWVDTRSDRAGIPRTEFLRRLLELYKASRERRVACPACGETQDYSSVVEA